MNRRRTRKERTMRNLQMTPIDVLPDDLLLAIFDFYVVRISQQKRDIEAWQSLVHVCRRWRSLVFESPRRLNLRLVCTLGTPARETLDVWPALPLIVRDTNPSRSVDNIVTALRRGDRVYQIHLRDLHRMTLGFQWDNVMATMQVPFPALTDLELRCANDRARLIPAIPDTFLGGSAPLLRYLTLECTPFPGIVNLLLSATHLIELNLFGVPRSGYISPEVMATCLSGLTSLRSLSLEFLSSRSRNDRERRRLPVTRYILPNLNSFWFNGASKYLEDLVAWVDAPRLHNLFITFRDRMTFDTPHLVQFISRTPGFKEPIEAFVILEVDAEVHLQMAPDRSGNSKVLVKTSSDTSAPQISSLAQVCTKCLPPLPTVETLYFDDIIGESDWKDDVGDDKWLEILRPFTAVKNFYLSETFQPNMASALRELVGDRTMEVLPSLQNIFLAKLRPSGPFQRDVRHFLAARQIFGHPIAISVW